MRQTEEYGDDYNSRYSRQQINFTNSFSNNHFLLIMNYKVLLLNEGDTGTDEKNRQNNCNSKAEIAEVRKLEIELNLHNGKSSQK